MTQRVCYFIGENCTFSLFIGLYKVFAINIKNNCHNVMTIKIFPLSLNQVRNKNKNTYDNDNEI